MSPLNDADRAAREQMLQAIMNRRACDREEAEVVMQRIAARLSGYTHDEVAQMYPLPDDEDVE